MPTVRSFVAASSQSSTARASTAKIAPFAKAVTPKDPRAGKGALNYFVITSFRIGDLAMLAR